MRAYMQNVRDRIEREKAGIDYLCTGADKDLLQTLLKELNEHAGTKLQYLAELDTYTIPGAGEIVRRYIHHFSSESVKSYLLPQLVADKVRECDKIALELYMQFRASRSYISEPGDPAPAHIYVRYDNALRTLKPKRLQAELVQLACEPRDFFYLPFTMKMLASWRLPEMENILILYSSENNVSEQDLGIASNGESYFPPFSFIKRELRLTAIDCLKYYPSAKTIETIRRYTTDKDVDISFVAKKTLKKLLTAK